LWFGFLLILVFPALKHFLPLALEVCLGSLCICAVDIVWVGLFHLLNVFLVLSAAYFVFYRLAPLSPVLKTPGGATVYGQIEMTDKIKT